MDNLEILASQLWSAGIRDIFVDGSFVTDKPRPGDIDGYFVCQYADLAFGHLAQRLNAISRAPIWAFDHHTWMWDPEHGPKPPSWFEYNVELYFEYVNAPAGVPLATLRDKRVPRFFRESRLDEPRGIVRIVR